MADEQEGPIVEQLYDLVTSPETYDSFMQSLHLKLETIAKGNRVKTSSVIGAHLKRASDLLDIVTPWQRSSDSDLHHYLSMKMQAVIAVGRNGGIRDANIAARALYDLPEGATIEDLPIASNERAKLMRQIDDTTNNKNTRNAPNSVMRFHNTKQDRSLLITVEPRILPSSGETLAILITSDVGWPSHLGSLLQDLFDLTQAEVEVVRLMVEGERVNGIAKRRSSSPATVRNQLRAIFSKTDTTSQLECVRMVFGLALMHDADEGALVATRIQAALNVVAYPRDDQRHILRLKNGRDIEYSIFGAAKGRTVLFYHDQAFGDVWFKEAVESAAAKGIRIVAPLRPGFGQTTLYEGPASEPTEFAPDIRELLDHLGVGKTAIIGVGSGLVHALAAAALMPDRITSISVGHPILPVIDDDDLEGLNGYNHLIPHARLHFPQAIRFLCKAGFAFVTTSGPAAFVKAVLRASPKDIEWVSRPEIMQTLEHGIHVHKNQGHVGNFGDINYRKDWRPLLKTCPAPVRLVIGENDRNVQWAAARRWSDAEAHISLHTMPDSGYLVHHQHNAKFIDWAKSDLKE